MSGTADELMDLKRRIEHARNQRAQAEGRLQTLMQRLESDFGIKTLSEGQKRLKQLQEETEKLSAARETSLDELRLICERLKNYALERDT